MPETTTPESASPADKKSSWRHSPWTIIVSIFFAIVVLGLLWAIAKPALDAYQLQSAEAAAEAQNSDDSD